MVTCAACGNEIPIGQEVTLRGSEANAPPITVCQSCARAAERELDVAAESPNLIRALLLGLGAAAISSVVWYGIVVVTQYQLGFIALGVGWLVGQAVVLGAGRQRGLRLQILSVAIALIAMIISEYLIVRHFVARALAADGYADVPLLLPANAMLGLIVESVKEDPLTLLFWGIAAWEAFIIPRLRPA